MTKLINASLEQGIEDLLADGTVDVEQSYSSQIQRIPMLSKTDEKAAYQAMNAAVLAQLCILTDSIQHLEILKDLILELEFERQRTSGKAKSSLADELNLIGLIDDLQTYLYFKDRRRIQQCRRQLKKKLAQWLPPGYLVNDRVNKLQKRLNKADERRDARAIRKRILKASQGYLNNRNRLSKANLRLVFSVANKFRYLGLPYEDLVQEGSLGLIKAIERFDPNRGFQFSTYAYRVISQTIHLALDKHSHLVRKPFRQLREKAVVDQTRNRLEQALGHAPNAQELEQALPDHLEDKTPHIERNIQPTADISILNLKSPDPEDHAELDLSAQAFQTQLLKHKAVLNQAIAKLDVRTQRILRMRFGLDISHNYTLKEISDNLSISGERVRQIAKKGVLELREHLNINETEWQ